MEALVPSPDHCQALGVDDNDGNYYDEDEICEK